MRATGEQGVVSISKIETTTANRGREQNVTVEEMHTQHENRTEVPAHAPAQVTTSVVICTRDRPDTIARAVESVASQPCEGFELLVVDQSRSDETRNIVERLMREYPNIRYIHLDKAGLSRAYNAGISNTSGAILAFTDDDCVAPATWLPTIVRCFAEQPDVALLYGQVLLPEEMIAREGADGVTPMLPIPQRRHLNRRNGFQVFGMGANFAVRRATWERIGGFDEVLGGGGPLKSSQDFDFAYRVYLAGGTILLEPDAIVYHYGFRSHAQWPATLKAYGIGDGAFYFKHVRAGDLFAARLLLGVLCLHTARECKHFIERGPSGASWSYVRNIVVGMYQSLRFGVNRQQRLYSIR